MPNLLGCRLPLYRYLFGLYLCRQLYDVTSLCFWIFLSHSRLQLVRKRRAKLMDVQFFIIYLSLLCLASCSTSFKSYGNLNFVSLVVDNVNYSKVLLTPCKYLSQLVYCKCLRSQIFEILGNSEVVLVKKPQNSTEIEDCLDSWTSNIDEACPNVFTGNGLIYLCGCNQTLAQVVVRLFIL